jgi:hypothetical protein
MAAMTQWLLGVLGAIVGFLGKSIWDLYWSRREANAKLAHEKRLAFIERQLSEFYWPLFFLLQKNNVVFERIVAKWHTNDGFEATLNEQLRRDYFYPNNEAMASLIEQKYHLAQADSEMEQFIFRFMRHQAVFKATRELGRQDLDPIRFGEPWPDGFLQLVENRTRALQQSLDRELRPRVASPVRPPGRLTRSLQ